MYNHLFLFQVHKEPELFHRILSHLESPNHYFIINIDKKSKDEQTFKKIINLHKNIIFTSFMNITHGGFSQISCTLHQIHQAQSSKIHFDYYHTLSGQDYPCVSVEEFDSFFDNNTQSYMVFDKAEDYPQWKYTTYPKRLEHYYVTDLLDNSFFRKIYLPQIINRFVYWIPRKYKSWESIWGGWNWFSLHESVIQYLIDYIEEHPKFVKRFKYTHCADELFFTTILHPVIQKFNIEAHNSLRYVDWHPKRFYTTLPLILNEEDYDSIIESQKFFCRKVEEKTSKQLLIKLDEKIQSSKNN